MSAWEPWANDPESFERACLAELERRLNRPIAARLMREPAAREIRGIRLDGSYPKTAIAISFLNLKTGGVGVAIPVVGGGGLPLRQHDARPREHCCGHLYLAHRTMNPPRSA